MKSFRSFAWWSASKTAKEVLEDVRVMVDGNECFLVTGCNTTVHTAWRRLELDRSQRRLGLVERVERVERVVDVVAANCVLTDPHDLTCCSQRLSSGDPRKVPRYIVPMADRLNGDSLA